MRQFLERVYVDANVLISDFMYRQKGQKADYKAHLAVQYLLAQPKITLYVGSFALVQLLRTASAAKLDKASLKAEIARLIGQFVLVHPEKKDIEKALLSTHPDIEDVLQYTLSQKVHCGNVVSNDRHFDRFKNVVVTKPGKIRQIPL